VNYSALLLLPLPLPHQLLRQDLPLTRDVTVENIDYATADVV